MKSIQMEVLSICVLILLAAASYRWTGFDAVILCSSVFGLTTANHLFSIQSKELGRVTGGCAAVLTFATSVGAGLNLPQLIFFTIIGVIVGYVVAAFHVNWDSTSNSTNESSPSNMKSGGGGDFGGGGADGKF